MRRAQNRRSQFPQRYCLIDTNRNNLSSKSWRRDRLIRLLLQFGHVITRKRLYSLIKWVQNPILVYHLSHSRRRALSKSVLDRLFADKKADLSGIRVYQTMKSIAERDGEVLDARQQAVKISWETPGVRSVVKNL